MIMKEDGRERERGTETDAERNEIRQIQIQNPRTTATDVDE